MRRKCRNDILDQSALTLVGYLASSVGEDRISVFVVDVA